MSYLKKVISYSLVKYFIFGLEGILFFIISKKLGPVYLGYYGFFTLLFTYMNFLNFGAIYALNKDLSIGNIPKLKVYLSSIFNIIMLGFIMIVLFSFIFQESTFLKKYEFSNFYGYLILWWLFFNIQSVVINIFRARHEIYTVSKIELLFATSKFTIVMLLLGYNNHLELEDIYLAIVIALAINIVLYRQTLWGMITFGFDKVLVKYILSLGVSLLVYEMSYILLISIDRFFIASFYAPSEMGEYTFAYTLNNFTFLFLTSAAYIVFPKALNAFYSFDRRYQKLMIVYISKLYFLLTVAFVLLALLIAPLVFSFYSEYVMSFFIFKILLLSSVIHSVAYWINAYHIANGNQNILVNILLKILVSTIITDSIVVYFELNFSWISIMSLFTLFMYSILLIHSLAAIFPNIMTFYVSLLTSLGYFIILYILFAYNIINYALMLVCILLYVVLVYKKYETVFFNIKRIIKTHGA